MTDDKKKATKPKIGKRVRCRALVNCEVEVAPGRSGMVAARATVVCSEATAKLLKDKLDVIGAV